jgi:hypoxanthine phosphoribosyltransferase
MNDKKILSWKEVEDVVQQFVGYVQFTAEELTDSVVVGIKRGGLIPAVMVSHQLDLPLEVINFQRIDNNDVNVNQRDIDKILQYKNIFIVDDIYDTGETINKIVDAIKARNVDNSNIEAFTLCLKEKHLTSQNDLPILNLAYLSELIIVNDNEWVVFPWESY